MEENRIQLWEDIRRIERRQRELRQQYQLTGDSELWHRADHLSYMLRDMYFQLREMDKSDRARPHYVRRHF